jgi:hypothetical protein
VYSPTRIVDASPRAKALSQDLAALIKERRMQDPSLGVPDAFVALELLKVSLLEESGVTAASGRVAAIAGVALAAVVTGVALFLMSR